jgi:hypothetical protein
MIFSLTWHKAVTAITSERVVTGGNRNLPLWATSSSCWCPLTLMLYILGMFSLAIHSVQKLLRLLNALKCALFTILFPLKVSRRFNAFFLLFVCLGISGLFKDLIVQIARLNSGFMVSHSWYVQILFFITQDSCRIFLVSDTCMTNNTQEKLLMYAKVVTVPVDSYCIYKKTFSEHLVLVSAFAGSLRQREPLHSEYPYNDVYVCMCV